MTKLNSPLLSLGARKSISGAITFQRRGGVNFVRTKPIPAYRYTLPQAYQRWLYEDYAYRWRQQSLATQRQYASDGVRHHLTGFQYWMKYQLSNLPDLAAYYKLDAFTGATSPDSSRNANTLAVFGASSIDALISRGLYFDGLNDYCRALDSGSLDITVPFSFEVFLRSAKAGAHQDIVSKFNTVTGTLQYLLKKGATNLLTFFCGGALGGNAANTIAAIALDTWYHVVCTYDGVNTIIYLDNVPQVNAVAPLPPVSSDSHLYLGMRENNTDYFEGILDHVPIFNRVLDATERQRHMERRYPV